MAYDGPERRRFTECPNPECRSSMNQFLQKINNSLFGPDEQSGLMKRIRKLEQCVGKKISRGATIGTAITVVGVLVVIFVPMVTGAIRTMSDMNERNIRVGDKADYNREEIGKLLKADEELETEHKDILKEMNTLINRSEQRLKEHIDLVIRSHEHSMILNNKSETENDRKATYSQ